MIGIIGAMRVEVEDLISIMTDETTETISSVTYHIGKINGVPCVVAQCGVGKVAAAVCAQTMILKYQPSALINVGVAGGIGENIHIGDIVISSGLVQHDMDTSAVGDEKGLISGLNLVTIPASKNLIDLVASISNEVFGQGVHIGIIATGDQFICSREKFQAIADEFGACACEMEGASIAQVCYINQVDFVVIRSISDNANEEASVDFNTFAVTSAHKLTELIHKLLPNIK
jgi:adenosylhomocysteine nucleosidase